MKEITFYKVHDDYGFMSNFAPTLFQMVVKSGLHRNIIFKPKSF